ncbi:hypothetical protein [Polyangium jinanense]|uniref:Uncharacterized protein n=1 Tax=Polyangium jinanense TaxID=2829994 RepID=A0A9X3XBV8_9BACT|nr:hypothetical protein [Polyangium jinanense]MDC3957019.1 hypothetical protein [Polyangium jinanense]MDC3986505.1 hypothetical protein [Polyangium jinanense]
MSSKHHSAILVRLLVPFAGALSFACVGCVENTAGDMALAEVQKLKAETRATEARLAALEGRQMYVGQQLSYLAGVIGEVGREAAAKAELVSRRQDEVAQNLERLERAGIERERARAAAESPQTIVARAQAMIDAGQIKATVKNGRTKLEAVEGAAPASPSIPPPSPPVAPTRSLELEDPWAGQRKPTAPASPPVKPTGRRMSDDLGF